MTEVDDKKKRPKSSTTKRSSKSKQPSQKAQKKGKSKEEIDGVKASQNDISQEDGKSPQPQPAPIEETSSVQPKAVHLSGAHSFINPWRRWDIILATVGLNILSLVLPLTILQFYDRIIPNHSYSTLSMFALGISVALVAEAILLFSRSSLLTWLGVNFESRMAVHAFDRLLHSQITQANRYTIGEHLHNIESVSTLREFMAGQGFLVLLDTPFLLLYLGLIYYFVGALVLVPFVVLTVFIILAIRIGTHLEKALDERNKIEDRRYSFLIEIFTNHHTAKAFAMEELLMRRFERISKHSSEVEYAVSHYSHEARDLGSLCSYFMFVGIVAFAASDVIQYKVSIGAMAACIVLSNRIVQPIQQLMGLWARYQYFQIARKRLQTIESLSLERLAPSTGYSDLNGDIRMENVTFQFEGAEKPILSQVNFHIQPGQIVTVRGDNGIGKSTLMRLIMGVFRPQSGQIFIDGRLHDDYPPQILRQNMAYLEPQGVLFQGTVMENITLFRSGVVREHAHIICRELGLESWIGRLPMGYDTQIGDSLFSLLPAGIQQRICLARALVMEPRILILDEANTALDLKGDEDLMRILLKIKGLLTIIIVTHRPSVDQIADVSYQVVNGTVTRRPLHHFPLSPVMQGASYDPAVI